MTLFITCILSLLIFCQLCFLLSAMCCQGRRLLHSSIRFLSLHIAVTPKDNQCLYNCVIMLLTLRNAFLPNETSLHLNNLKSLIALWWYLIMPINFLRSVWEVITCSLQKGGFCHVGRSELLWGAMFGFHASAYLLGTALESYDSGIWSSEVYTQMHRHSFASWDSQIVQPLTLEHRALCSVCFDLHSCVGGVTSSSWEDGLAQSRQPASSTGSAHSLLARGQDCPSLTYEANAPMCLLLISASPKLGLPRTLKLPNFILTVIFFVSQILEERKLI